MAEGPVFKETRRWTDENGNVFVEGTVELDLLGLYNYIDGGVDHDLPTVD